jgi:hypothetical protein
MSPELALVDPELRADAIATLPPIYVNAFLKGPPRVVIPAPVVVFPAPVVTIPAPATDSPSVHVPAVLAYLVLALGRTLAFDALVFASVAVLVLVASLIS